MTLNYICIDWGGSELKGTCLNEMRPSRNFKFSAGNLRQLNEDGLLAICQRLQAEFADLAGESLVWLIGAAGADDRKATARLEKILPDCCPGTAATHVYSDYACNHAACLDGEDGILSINGTGSVLYAVFGKQKTRTGGWGFILDETPSGAYFGRRALEGVLRSLEGDPAYADYSAAFSSRFGEPERQTIIDELYRSGSMQLKLGSYAPVLTDAFSRNNPRARQIIGDSIALLAAACKRLVASQDGQTRKFCGSGGLWANWPQFSAMFAAEIEKQQLELRMVKPAVSLHYGPLINFARTDNQAKKMIEMLKSQENWK